MRESVAHSCSSADPCTTSRTVLPASEVVALVEDGHAHAAGAGHAAVVGLLHAGQDAQQGRLAGAVGADDADALAVVEPEGDLVEKGARAQRERDAVRAEKVSHLREGYPQTRTDPPRRRPIPALTCGLASDG